MTTEDKGARSGCPGETAKATIPTIDPDAGRAAGHGPHLRERQHPGRGRCRARLPHCPGNAPQGWGYFFPNAVPRKPPTNLPRANYVLLVSPVRAHAHGDPISRP